ncbi:MAG: type IIA DNA topoisomerase subunit B [Bacteroidetes bacterium]|nr:MAG: type IIA DNA topoisomerase subunit B [Bacteroidota bacterium]
MSANYNEDSIRSLEWDEHIRLRPGMYIGKLGDGSSHDDGIYVLIKEIIDNSIDEFIMGNGKTIEVSISDKMITVRDYGRGIPLGKVIECVSRMNTGAKYEGKAFKKTVGLNGVGTKAVNALAGQFTIQSIRDGKTKIARFEKGVLVEEFPEEASNGRRGTKVSFIPDEEIFGKYRYINDYIEKMLWNYVFLNKGLAIHFNGNKLFSERGLFDLLTRNIDTPICYPIIHLQEDDLEFAFTHSATQYSEEYFSFVNGQHTTQGGTHQNSFREVLTKTIRDFYKRDFDASDIKTSIIVALSIRVNEPVFESQTKTKLGSQYMDGNGNGGATIRNYIADILKRRLDNYLHMNPETADALLKKILQSERERKDMASIKKLAKERVKKASLHNKKLRDCRVHYNGNHEKRQDSTLFITEGDSASGSITKARDVNTQAVFSLKGKPLNCYGLTKKIVYENEEFNLLQAALNIEDSIEDLRYNNIVIATDADVDGMHIRLLLITFFLQFFPDLVRNGHLFILQTPLFRVRNKQQTIYCYSENERRAAMEELKGKPEITRFKGLGEISPDEFENFIGKGIRLDPVLLQKDGSLKEMLEFYMGKNTPDRQNFIIDNLRVDLDLVETP